MNNSYHWFRVVTSKVVLLDTRFDSSYDDIIESCRRGATVEPSDGVVDAFDNNIHYNEYNGHQPRPWTLERKLKFWIRQNEKSGRHAENEPLKRMLQGLHP